MTDEFQTVHPLAAVRNSVYISIRRAPGTTPLCRVIAFEDSLDPGLQDLYGDFDPQRASAILLELGMNDSQAEAVAAESIGSAQVQRFRMDLSAEQCAFLQRTLAAPAIDVLELKRRGPRPAGPLVRPAGSLGHRREVISHDR